MQDKDNDIFFFTFFFKLPPKGQKEDKNLAKKDFLEANLMPFHLLPYEEKNMSIVVPY